MNFSIDTFMTRGLQLSKTELLVYALIHNFSQDGQGCYWGSLSTTAEILNCSEQSVKNAIKALMKRNLLKSAGIHPEFRTVQYIALVPAGIKEKIEGAKNLPYKGQKISPMRGKKFAPIINNDNKIDNKGISVFENTLEDMMKQYES